MNISGTDQVIDKRKTALPTTIYSNVTDRQTDGQGHDEFYLTSGAVSACVFTTTSTLLYDTAGELRRMPVCLASSIINQTIAIYYTFSNVLESIST